MRYQAAPEYDGQRRAQLSGRVTGSQPYSGGALAGSGLACAIATARIRGSAVQAPSAAPDAHAGRAIPPKQATQAASSHQRPSRPHGRRGMAGRS
ncbi:MAG: hypothetical protein GAK30_01355 [Paracidovorax wautersii]|uniref:Uncharacterized protein n=1 Tax=Paracidovorax wautersii TaxID=1177982 RepID=A0A7V8FQ65_9BURK|nr:MAG: hypothetical protein GAK30_01355 [Paracidovorax wautersii]